MPLSCYVLNFEMIGQLRNTLWLGQISGDLRWVSEIQYTPDYIAYWAMQMYPATIWRICVSSCPCRLKIFKGWSTQNELSLYLQMSLHPLVPPVPLQAINKHSTGHKVRYFVRHGFIIWTNAGLFSTGPVGTNFSEISIKNTKVPFLRKYMWKCRSQSVGHFLASISWYHYGVSNHRQFLFLQLLVWASIRENTKASHHRHLVQRAISAESVFLSWRHHVHSRC